MLAKFLFRVTLRRLDLAEEVDTASLASAVTRGQRLDVVLEGSDVKIEEANQHVIWQGSPCVSKFHVMMPKLLDGSSCLLRVRVLLDSVPNPPIGLQT